MRPQYTKPGVGRPDIALIKPGQPARAFIELKAPGKSADPKEWKGQHDKRQYGRLQELAHWAASNFFDFRLFERDKLVGKAAILPAEAIDPAISDGAAEGLIDAHDPARFRELLAQLLRAHAPPPLGTPLDEISSADILFMHDLAVGTAGRGPGIGRRLVEGAFDLAVRDGLRSAGLVAVEGAAAFWLAMGFTALDATPEIAAKLAGYGRGAAWMGRAIG